MNDGATITRTKVRGRFAVAGLRPEARRQVRCARGLRIVTAAAILTAQECAASRCECHESAKRGHGVTHCLAPDHEDRTPSMNVTDRQGKVLLKCHSGCAQSKVFDAARAGGFLGDDRGPKPEEVAAYPYTDALGDLRYEVVRFEPGFNGERKTFRQRHPNGDGTVVWGMAGVERVPYHLPDVIDAVADGRTVWIAEGEKDVEALTRAGVTATCNSEGAGKWRPEFAGYFRGADVVIVQDRDQAGYEHAAAVFRSLDGTAAKLRIVEAITGKDAADHLAAGHGLDDFAPAKPVRPDQGPGVIAKTIDGAAFILDAPPTVPAIWGKDQDVLWARGEALMIVGPTGTGKTTLAGQLVLALIGAADPVVLDYPVEPIAGRLLYLGLDRPEQIRRSFARMVSEEQREVLAERLVFWRGPLPFDPLEDNQAMIDLVRSVDAGGVVIDSLKDINPALNDPIIAGKFNQLRQRIIAEDIRDIELHHQRKAQGLNRKPTKIDDVFGGAALVWGAGSVILLWGEPGESVVDFKHLKQPLDEVGPFQVTHDADRGRSTVTGRIDVFDLLRHTSGGLTIPDLARALYHQAPTTKPKAAQLDRARYLLERLVKRGDAREQPGQRGGPGGSSPGLFFATDRHRDQDAADPLWQTDSIRTPFSGANEQTDSIRTDLDAEPEKQTEKQTDTFRRQYTPDPTPVGGPGRGSKRKPCPDCENDPVTTDPATGRTVCRAHAPPDSTEAWWT